MRILYFITRSDTVGGAQVHARDLSKALSACGHDTKVIVGGNGLYFDQLRKLDIAVESIDGLKREISPLADTKAIVRFRRMIRDFRPDVISLHSAKAGLIGRLAAIGLNAKVLFTAHGWSHIRTARGVKFHVFRIIEKLLAPLSDTIITVCDEDREFARVVLRLPINKIKTVHNALPDTSLRRPENQTGGILRFVTVARFQEPKDFNTLIAGFGQLESNNWTLDIIGDGPDEARVKALVRESKLDDKIRLLGRSDEVAERLCQSDVFVLISKSEGFPRSIIEAMRCGLPVIATDVGGIRESVSDSENGFLIPKEDAGVLTDKLKSFLANPAMVDQMGASSRRLYEENLTFDVLVRKTLGLYS